MSQFYKVGVKQADNITAQREEWLSLILLFCRVLAFFLLLALSA